MPRFIRVAIAAAGLIAIGSCSEAGVAPEPASLSAAAAKLGADRVLAITLTAPNANDAGMLFSVDGPNILDVVPATGYDVMTSETDGKGRSTVKVLLLGPLKSGVVAYAMVKGANSGNPFTATISQVATGAGGGFAQRADLTPYSLAVTAQR
jgi:hypothetical protein